MKKEIIIDESTQEVLNIPQQTFSCIETQNDEIGLVNTSLTSDYQNEVHFLEISIFRQL